MHTSVALQREQKRMTREKEIKGQAPGEITRAMTTGVDVRKREKAGKNSPTRTETREEAIN